MRPNTVLLPVCITTPGRQLGFASRRTSARTADHQRALQANVARFEDILVGLLDGSADRLRLASQDGTVQLEIRGHLDKADIGGQL